jgi:hypothetical protein
VVIIARVRAERRAIVARQTFAAGWLRDEQGSDLIHRIEQTSVAETWFKPIPMAGELKTEPRMGATGIASSPRAAPTPRTWPATTR